MHYLLTVNFPLETISDFQSGWTRLEPNFNRRIVPQKTSGRKVEGLSVMTDSPIDRPMALRMGGGAESRIENNAFFGADRLR